ncbi:hypothetical protein, partial [Burkholderia cepacia]|uniref:hypothetical protein n=1 Tax=Burkholderia cepacia TaxID=292 RepID=UPI001CE46ACC
MAGPFGKAARGHIDTSARIEPFPEIGATDERKPAAWQPAPPRRMTKKKRAARDAIAGRPSCRNSIACLP